MSSRQRQQAEKRGRRAEMIAALWLMAHGWRIIARRRRTPWIELDLVARRGDVLAVIEVKRRASIDAAILAVTPDAVRRLRQAAHQLVTMENARGNRLSARVDLFALAPGVWPRHIPAIDSGC